MNSHSGMTIAGLRMASGACWQSRSQRGNGSAIGSHSKPDMAGYLLQSEYGRQDSNLHRLAGSPQRALGSTSSGFQNHRVCQFRHARVKRDTSQNFRYRFICTTIRQCASRSFHAAAGAYGRGAAITSAVSFAENVAGSVGPDQGYPNTSRSPRTAQLRESVSLDDSLDDLLSPGDAAIVQLVAARFSDASGEDIFGNLAHNAVESAEGNARDLCRPRQCGKASA